MVEPQPTDPLPGGDETAIAGASAEGTRFAVGPKDEPSHRGGTVPPGTLLSHTYRIEALIARGGMGEVYRARHAELDTLHALKIILPELVNNPKVIDLFRREASVLRHVRHAAIVGYDGVFRDEAGRVYLVMEFVDGPSLAQHLRARSALSPAEVRRLRDRLVPGLAEAHDQGVIHRDLSPDNIILEGGQLEKAKIIDFGIAKLEDPSAGTIVGKDFAGRYSFASPEQFGMYGGLVDARSDIYSLGLVLAASATGANLNMGHSLLTVIKAREVIPDLSFVPEELLPELRWMLQPNPADRPQSMRELVAAGPEPGTSASRPPGIAATAVPAAAATAVPMATGASVPPAGAPLTASPAPAPAPARSGRGWMFGLAGAAAMAAAVLLAVFVWPGAESHRPADLAQAGGSAPAGPAASAGAPAGVSPSPDATAAQVAENQGQGETTHSEQSARTDTPREVAAAPPSGAPAPEAADQAPPAPEAASGAADVPAPVPPGAAAPASAPVAAAPPSAPVPGHSPATAAAPTGTAPTGAAATGAGVPSGAAAPPAVAAVPPQAPAAATPPAEAAEPPAEPAPEFERSLMGRRAVQEDLQRLGFYSGALNGIFGPTLRSAVRTYQQSIGHEPTGQLTRAERQRLRTAATQAAARETAGVPPAAANPPPAPPAAPAPAPPSSVAPAANPALPPYSPASPAPTAATPPGTLPAPGQAIPTPSASLSPGDIVSVTRAIQPCWRRHGRGITGVRGAGIEVRLYMRPDRTVERAEIVDAARAASDPAYRAAAEAAVRAATDPACQPLPLPEGGYNAWRTVRLSITAGGMF